MVAFIRKHSRPPVGCLVNDWFVLVKVTFARGAGFEARGGPGGGKMAGRDRCRAY
jgi:hypothetical protein